MCETVLVIAAGSALALAPKVTTLVSEASVTGIPDKVFTLITADWPPGVTTGVIRLPETNTARWPRGRWSRGRTAANGRR
jgi:hypothetical protein